jgi:hypothetical protein
MLVAALAVTVGGGLAIWAGVAGSGTRSQAAPKSTYSVEKARSFSRFPLYSAGESVAGYPLVAVLHEQRHPVETVSFIYGDCVVPQGEGGCAPPVSVQVWPACFRNPSLYRAPPFGPPFEKTTVRGVPAEIFEDGARLEIYTGRSAVVIYADEPLKVAAALRGVNNPVSAGAPLPPAAPGVMTGDVSCAGG